MYRVLQHTGVMLVIIYNTPQRTRDQKKQQHKKPCSVAITPERNYVMGPLASTWTLLQVTADREEVAQTQ